MTRARAAMAIVGVALVGALAVARPPRGHGAVAAPRASTAPVAAPAAGAREVDDADAPSISGCATVLRDGTCELPRRATLRVFVAADASRVRFTAGPSEIAPERAFPLRDGVAFEVHLPEDARALVVAVDATTVLTLHLAPPRPLWPALEQARARRAEGKLDEAESLAQGARAAATDDGDRARAVSLLARIALSRGDERQIDALFAESADLQEHAGRPASAAEDLFAHVFSLLGRRRLTEARRVLLRARELSSRYPEGQVRALYYASWIASVTARFRDALSGFRRTAVLAERLGMPVERRSARALATTPLSALGRTAEAVDNLVALYDAEAATSSPCEVADMVANVGIAALDDAARGKVDARAWLERARVLYSETCATSYDPMRLANLLGELARAEARSGNLHAAHARLDEATRAAPHPREALALEWLHTRGDLALAEGDLGAALRAFDRLASRARAIDDTEAERLALEGRAEALALRGDREGAAAALAQAAERVDRETLDAPLGEGREGFLRGRERADARRVELLVELGHPREALAHLRHAQARLMTSLAHERRVDALPPDARARWEDAVATFEREREQIERDAEADWKLAASTLEAHVAERARRAGAARAAFEAAYAEAMAGQPRPPTRARAPAVRAGELVLAYQATARGWLGFAADADGVRAQRLGAIDLRRSQASLAESLLGPFAPEIARARRVSVLAFGEARRVDVHALPWAGAPLVARVPVDYPIGGDATLSADPLTTSGQALVVGDPTLDLGFAHAELAAVRDALADAGVAPAQTATLVGDAATPGAVRAALATADLFHYAGHAAFAGRDGSESALRLAGGELGILDVLALGHAPRIVVLLGCETARTSEITDAQGLGMAHAFLIAGTRAVVASTRAVDDGATAELSRHLYASLTRGDAPVVALQSAQRALSSQGSLDWAAFRLFVQ